MLPQVAVYQILKTKVLQAFHKLNKIWEFIMADSMEKNLYVAPFISCYLLWLRWRTGWMI